MGQLIRITRIYGIKNPVIKRGAEICALYVFGCGFEIRSDYALGGFFMELGTGFAFLARHKRMTIANTL